MTAWLQANTGALPLELAIDGKSVEDGRYGGRPVAMTPADGKKENLEKFPKPAPCSPNRMSLEHRDLHHHKRDASA